jgi:hypothetical protein
MPRSSSRAVYVVGIWRLQHSMPLDEVEQGGTVFEYMTAEPQAPMLSFGDRAAGPNLEGAAEERLRSVAREPGPRRSEPSVLRTERQKVAG